MGKKKTGRQTGGGMLKIDKNAGNPPIYEIMQIDKNIPVPPPQRRGVPGEIMQIDKNVPLDNGMMENHMLTVARADRMEAGDSVFLDTFSPAYSLRIALVRRGKKAAQRREGNGWRVWRVE